MKFCPLALPNVEFTREMQDKLAEQGLARENLRIVYDIDGIRELLWELASKQPLWRFILRTSGSGPHKMDSPIDTMTHSLYIKDVVIFHGREKLGSFNSEYHGSTRKIFITNERIAKERTGRNNGRMVTSDIKKALREITKNFYAKNPVELTTDALKKANSALAKLHNLRHHDSSMAEHHFSQAAAQFALDHPEILDCDIQDTNKDKAKEKLAELHLSKKAEAEITDMLEPVQKLLNKNNPPHQALVISQGSSYVLTYKGETSTISSEDLPQELRGHLGFLKLSESNQVMPGVGYRVDNDIFLVFPMENNDAA